MTWYFVDLGEEGVVQVNRLFDKFPFAVEKKPAYTNAYFVIDNKRRYAFMSYTKKDCIIYKRIIESFPLDIQTTIQRRLKTVSSLENILCRK